MSCAPQTEKEQGRGRRDLQGSWTDSVNQAGVGRRPQGLPQTADRCVGHLSLVVSSDVSGGAEGCEAEGVCLGR